MDSDAALLSRFARSRDAAAFAGLVERYLPLVYASARRRVADPALADDVCQAVFLVLAKKAAVLQTDQPVADWLRTVTRYAAANAVKQRARRRRHEAAAATPEAVMPDATTPTERAESAAAWTTHLDAALDRLPAADRRAVLLRYYGDADFAAVAAALNVSEAAARKRVTRAVGRLRGMFVRRGVAVPAATFVAALPVALSLAPPPALAASVTAAATSSSAALAGPAVLISKGTLHAMITAKLKVVAAVALSLTALAGTGVGIAVVLAGASAATGPAAALKPVVGWLKATYRFDPAAPPRVTYVEPSSGRLVVMNDASPGQVEAFVDPPGGVDGRWFADVKQFVVGPHEIDDQSSISHIYGDARQYTAADVLAEMDSAGGPAGDPVKVTATVRPGDAGGERVTDIAVHKSRLTVTPPDAIPDAFEMHTDVAIGVIRRLTASVSKDGKTTAYDVVRTEPVAGPPVDLNRPETFALPAGATRVDNRPSAEVRKLLADVDDVLDRGPGFDTAVLVSRSASPTSGEFAEESDTVAVYAGTAQRFVLARWALSPVASAFRGEPQSIARPAHWPKPTLADVLAAAGDTRPNYFVVYDGTTCWTTAGSPWAVPTPVVDSSGRTVVKRPERVWLNDTPVGQLWGTLRQLSPTVWTKMTLTRDADAGGKVVLESRVSGVMQIAPATRPAVVPMKTIRLTFLDDLGPYPVKIEIADTTPWAGRRLMGTRVVDISTEAGGMYREPVRVPKQWRTMFVGEDDPSTVRYDTLRVETKTKVPAAWFEDPAKTWPKR